MEHIVYCTIIGVLLFLWLRPAKPCLSQEELKASNVLDKHALEVTKDLKRGLPSKNIVGVINRTLANLEAKWTAELIPDDKNYYPKFHGGCMGCKTPQKKGIGNCKGCQYFAPDWNLPNLKTK